MTNSSPRPKATPAALPISPQLDEMTRERALESLRGLLGDGEAADLWSEACRQAGVAADGPLDFDELERVADALMSHPGPISLVGSSLSIRVRTYRMLDGAQRLGSFLETKP